MEDSKNLNDQIVSFLGMDGASDEEKAKTIEQVMVLLQRRIMVRLNEFIADADPELLKQLTSDFERLIKYIKAIIPDFDKILKEEVDAIKQDLKEQDQSEGSERKFDEDLFEKMGPVLRAFAHSALDRETKVENVSTLDKKAGDSSPIQEGEFHFSGGGIIGDVTVVTDPEDGEPQIKIEHITADKKAIESVLVPDYKNIIKDIFGAGGDAAVQVAVEDLKKIAQKYAAYRALLEDMKSKNGNLAVMMAVEKEMNDLLEKSSQIGVQFLGENSSGKKTKKPAKSKAPNLEALELEPEQKNKVSRAIEYQKAFAEALQGELKAFAVAEKKNPKLAEIEKAVDKKVEELLKKGPHSAKEILERAKEGKLDDVPEVELLKGTGTVIETALLEAKDEFSSLIGKV